MKNPFGNDFIRLEVDADRFRHNKTGSGGIHHIPLIINGYPDIVEKTKLQVSENISEKSHTVDGQKVKSSRRGNLNPAELNQRRPDSNPHQSNRFNILPLFDKFRNQGGRYKFFPNELFTNTVLPKKFAVMHF